MGPGEAGVPAPGLRLMFKVHTSMMKSTAKKMHGRIPNL